MNRLIDKRALITGAMLADWGANWQSISHVRELRIWR